MLDHVFLEAIGVVRRALEDALLERHAPEERLQADVLLGDLSWETSYTLPGEGLSPRVSAEITLDWPTWSQTALRLSSIGEPTEDSPEINVEVVLRLNRLASRPDPERIATVLPEKGPEIDGQGLDRARPLIEEYTNPEQPSFALEVAYEGLYEIDPDKIEDHTALLGLQVLGAWIASDLVKLADLDLKHLPPEPDNEELDR